MKRKFVAVLETAYQVSSDSVCFVSLVVAVVVRQNVAHRVGGKAVF